MSNVIPMFVIDEITGLKVPNVPSKPDYNIVKDGIGYAVGFETYQKALAALHKYPEGCEIIKM